MEKVGKAIVKLRIPILILSVLLLIPAGIGYVKTKVNYDILYYPVSYTHLRFNGNVVPGCFSL